LTDRKTYLTEFDNLPDFLHHIFDPNKPVQTVILYEGAYYTIWIYDRMKLVSVFKCVDMMLANANVLKLNLKTGGVSEAEGMTQEPLMKYYIVVRPTIMGVLDELLGKEVII